MILLLLRLLIILFKEVLQERFNCEVNLFMAVLFAPFSCEENSGLFLCSVDVYCVLQGTDLSLLAH